MMEIVADNENTSSPAMMEIVAENENTSVYHDDQQRKKAENIRPHSRQQNTAYVTKN